MKDSLQGCNSLIERRKILRLWQSLETGAPSVLATVVRIGGSSYRKPGAHLLVAENGLRVGSISGGCLEAEVIRKAQWLTSSGAVMKEYSTFFEDSSDLPYGLGCGGTVELLMERVATEEGNALFSAIAAALNAEGRVVATALPGPGPLERAVWDEQGNLVYRSDGFTMRDSRELFSLGKRTGICETELGGNPRRIYFEFLTAQPSFYLCGAGDDAMPVGHLADWMGWNVVVSDSRTDLVTPARFPGARMVPTESLAATRFRSTDAAVIMTHSYEQDGLLLRTLLPKSLGYLGLLGAKSRSQSLLKEAVAFLGWSFEEGAKRLHAPVGLDLGGDGPEAIALAIVAEAHAGLHRGSGSCRPDIQWVVGAAPFQKGACPQ